MKHILILSMFIWINTALFGQNYNEYTLDELRQKQTQAIKNEDFETAQLIKQEIESRKSLEEIKEDTQNQLDKAIKNEDYKQTTILKEKLKIIENIAIIKKEIDKAVNSEDFKKASELKEQKNALLLSLNQTTAEVQQPTQSNQQTASLFFTSDNKAENFDVLIDGEYVGSYRRGKNLLVENISLGEHKINFYPMAFPNKDNFSFNETIDINSTKIISVDYKNEYSRYIILNKESKKAKNILGNELFNISEISKEKADNVYLTTDYNNRDFIEPKMAALYNTTSFKTDFGYYLSSPLPVSRDWGWALHFEGTNTYLLTDFGLFTGYTMSLHSVYYQTQPSLEYAYIALGIIPNIGFQFEPTNSIIIQGAFNAGPYFCMYDELLPEDVKFSVAFGSYVNANFQYYFTKTMGVIAESGIGAVYGGSFTPTINNVKFSIGIVGRGIMDPKYRYKHYVE
ncbi:MAG: UvrB/UvrC motif-containing protein [Cyclobacteriaceae bacterium]|nr:UvrB/UvrC motif-containing protein [Cyclobacteriaceae bacterium]